MFSKARVKITALGVICLFAGIATAFAGLYDLWKITSPGFDSGYMDYVVMAGVTSMGFVMLALAAILVLNANWAFYIALTFTGIAVSAFTIGAFHTNLFFGISLLCGIGFIIGFIFKSKQFNNE